MPYCEGCNTRYVDTGCGQDVEHARCPWPCSLCRRPMTGRDTPDACTGHSMAEVREAIRLRHPHRSAGAG